MKKTVVIGASPNPARYSYMATNMLSEKGHEVIPVGIRKGKINSHDIFVDQPVVENIDTVTLYVGPQNQGYWEEYIFSLNPKRIIFNPGTENSDFEKKVREKGIESIRACTLVMLSIGSY